MAFLGDDEWEWTPRRRGRHSPANIHEYRRSEQFLNPQAHFTGLHRTRSQGHAPVPVVNVFNDLHQNADLRNSSNSPPYSPQQASHPPTPQARSRHRRSNSRLGERLGEELLAEELAQLALERRLGRSRSRGRSEAAMVDRNREYYQWQAEQARRELREIEHRRAWEREEERIKSEIELKRVKSEVKRKADEEAADAERKRTIEQYEREKAEKAAKAKRAEEELLAKIQRETRERQEREEREYKEFLAKQKQKKEAEEKSAREEKEKVDEAMRKRLRKSGYTEEQVEAVLAGEKPRNNTTTTTTTTTTLQRWQNPRQPVYAKVHRDFLSTETLVYYDIPYEYDRCDPNYIIILREMDKYETDVLFEHTKRLRSGKLLLEAPKKRQEYAWFRSRGRSRSKGGKGEIKRYGILEVSRK